MRPVNLHCDGACLENGKPHAMGGYGIIVESEGKILETQFGKLRVGVQTNNRAELEAVLKALEYIKETGDPAISYILYSDSTTVVDGILGIAKRKANRDIWQDIETICQEINQAGYQVSVVHCNKDKLDPEDIIYQMNVQADLLAFRGANALIIC